MKINKIIKICFPVLALAILVTGCKQDPIFERAESDLFEVGGAVLNVFNIEGNAAYAEPLTYDFDEVNRTPISFDLDQFGGTLESANIYVAHNGGTPGLHKTVSSLASSETLDIDECIAAAGITPDDVNLGDVFTVSFDSNVGGVTVASGTTIDVGVFFSSLIFKSEIQGEFGAVTTLTNQMAGYDWDNCEGQTWEGTVKYINEHVNPQDDGVYQVISVDDVGADREDMSHGAYYPCYNSPAANMPLGDLRLSDVDGKISITGASQWGEVFSVTELAVAGNVLTFSWVNDYGEGATVQLTAAEDWPDNLTN